MVFCHSKSKHNSCLERFGYCPLCCIESQKVSDEEHAKREKVIVDLYSFPDSYFDTAHNHMNEKRKWWQFRPIYRIKKFLFMLDFEKCKKEYRRSRDVFNKE